MDVRALIQWHQGIIETLRDRQFWASLVTIIGLVLQNFLGIHVSQTVLLGWILTGLSLVLGSSIAQAGHAVATSRLVAQVQTQKSPSTQ
jgi:hypothetical protein